MKNLQRLMALIISVSLGWFAVPVQAGEAVSTKIIEVDQYGNALLEISPAALLAGGFTEGDTLTVTVGETALEVPLCTVYSDVDAGEPLLCIRESAHTVLLAVYYGSFAEDYRVYVGEKVTLRLLAAGGYAAELEAHRLDATDSRQDYASDEAYANFRMVQTAGIGQGVLYRSGSPVENIQYPNRPAYVEALLEKTNVQAVVNLCLTKEAAETYQKDASKSVPKAYENLTIQYTDTGVSLGSPTFAQKMVEICRFLANQDGPYLIHCTYGIDRTGLVCALLEGLMGATKAEISQDYMQSYVNYYGLKVGSESYQNILQKNLLDNLAHNICGLDPGAELAGTDFSAAVSAYLLENGLTQTELDGLKQHLSGESPQATAQVEAAQVVYEVKVGDCLYKIAREVYGDPDLWPVLYLANLHQIQRAERIYPGQVLIVPAID